MGTWSVSGVYIPDYDETNYNTSFATGITNLETALAARLIVRATASDAAANLQSGSAGLTGTFLPALLGVGLGAGTLPGAGVTAELRGTGTQARLSYDGTNRLDVSVNSTGDATLDASGDDLTLPDRVAFTHASAPIVSAKAGPTTSQQHTIPAVTSDTFALLAAAQTLTNKTLTSPAINGGAINSATIGATTASTGAFTTVTASTSVTTPTVATASGDLVLNPANGSVLPNTNDTMYLGSLVKRWLGLYAAELTVSTLVRENVITTAGGRLLVGKTTVLTADLTNVATTITVKDNNLSNGDRIYLEKNGSYEYMAVTSAAGGSAGAYTYSVTRNLDGTGADAWANGDTVFNTGTTNSGWLDLFASTGMYASAAATGPAIVAYKRTGTAYNAFSPYAAFGHLNGLYGKSSGVWGFAAGDYAGGNYVTANTTDGVKVVAGSGKHTLDSTGLTLDAATTSLLQMKASTVNIWKVYADATFSTQTSLYSVVNGDRSRDYAIEDRRVFGKTSAETVFQLVADELNFAPTKHEYVNIWGGSGSNVFRGVNVGYASAAPAAMLDVWAKGNATQLRLRYDATHYADETADSSGNLQVAPSGTYWALANAKKLRLNTGVQSDLSASAAGAITVEIPTAQGVTITSPASPLLKLVDTASPTPWYQVFQMEANGYAYFTNNGNGYRIKGKDGVNQYYVFAPSNEAVSLQLTVATDGNTYVYPSGGSWFHEHVNFYHRSFAKSALGHYLQFHGDGTAPAAGAELLLQQHRVNSDAIAIWHRFTTSGAAAQWDIGVPASSSDLWFRRTADGSPGLALLYSSQYVQTNWSLKVAGNIGFYGTTPISQPNVTGSRSGGTALTNLLTALANLGLIANGTSA